MGTGKTTVGRLLAERMGRRFVDLDDAVTADAGQPIAEIFRSGGEAAFRRLEQRALGRVLADPDIVLATGGGAACREPNLSMMLSSSQVVALSAPPEEVLRRTGVGSGRPLLDTAADPLAGSARALAAAGAVLCPCTHSRRHGGKATRGRGERGIRGAHERGGVVMKWVERALSVAGVSALVTLWGCTDCQPIAHRPAGAGSGRRVRRRRRSRG